ncbi:MAG: hypothetical protein ABW087_21680 [Candidatus Thiodiazotropha sp.]
MGHLWLISVTPKVSTETEKMDDNMLFNCLKWCTKEKKSLLGRLGH